MKKNIILTFLFLIIFLAGCEQPVNETEKNSTNGSLSIAIAGLTSAGRSLVPNDSLLALITTYEVDAVQNAANDPDPETLTAAEMADGYRFEDIQHTGSGDLYSVTVTGRDSDNNIIAFGESSDIAVSSNITTDVTVTMLPQAKNSNSGTASIIIVWPNTIDVASVDYTNTLIGSSPGTATSLNTINGSPNDSAVVFNDESISSGEYILAVNLYNDNNAKIASVYEIMLIFDFRETVATITLGTEDFGTKPTAPTDLTLEQKSDGSILLNWTDNANTEEGFHIYRSDDMASPRGTVDYTATTYTDTAPLIGNPEYTVVAYNTFGESSPISDTIDTAKPAIATAGLIRGMTVRNGSSISQTFSWNAASDNVTSTGDLQYQLFYSNTDLDASDINDIKDNATSAGNPQAFTHYSKTISGLNETTGTYYIYLIVSDAAGNNAVYDEYLLDIQRPKPDTATADAKGVITGSAIQSDSITISWEEATDNSTSFTPAGDLTYEIYYAESQISDLNTIALAESSGSQANIDYASGTHSAVISKLKESQTYRVAIIVSDEQGNKSLYANGSEGYGFFQFVTLEDKIAPGITGTISQTAPHSDTSISVTWDAATDNNTPEEDILYKLVVKEGTSTIQMIDYTEGMTSATIDANGNGLKADTNYTFELTVWDGSSYMNGGSEVLNETSLVSGPISTEADATAPIPGGSQGTPTPANPHRAQPPLSGMDAYLTIAPITNTQNVNISWDAASDDHTRQQDIVYRVYYSETRGDVENTIGSSAQQLGSNLTGTTSLSSISLPGITGDTYYFNVEVSDSQGNTALYEAASLPTDRGVAITVTFENPQDDELSFSEAQNIEVLQGETLTISLSGAGYTNHNWFLTPDAAPTALTPSDDNADTHNETVTIDTTNLSLNTHYLTVAVNKSDGYVESGTLTFIVTNQE